MFKKILEKVFEWRFARYTFSGGVSAVPGLVAIIFLVESGLYYITAVVIGSSVQWIIGFWMHRSWAFRNNGKIFYQIVPHALLQVAYVVLKLSGMYILVSVFGWYYLFALFVVITPLSGVSYLATIWIFRDE